MNTNARVLVVDDEPDIRELVKEILQDEGYVVDVADGAVAAREKLLQHRPDIVLLDIWMPDVDGITLLKEWKHRGRLPFPVVIMSGHGTVETAVEATRLGAHDFIEKPLSMGKLLQAVQHALGAGKAEAAPLPPVQEPIGKSATMEQLREQIRKIASHDKPVLVSGEPGVGKKTAVRYLHHLSERRNAPLVEIEAGAIALSHAGQELLGFEDGRRVTYGWIEQANGGTLFISHIDQLDLSTQLQLLNVLRNRALVRVGGRHPLAIDVRLIATSQRDLAGEVAAGRFREDLYYLLNVLPLNVCPLRDHCEDVPDLLKHYVDLSVERENLPYRRFSVAAQNRLRHYDWPGNIRELRNLVQRLLILGSGEVVELEEVEAALSVAPVEPAAPMGYLPIPYDLPLREAREMFERAYLEFQLKESGGSVARLAKLVGMERTHLYRKLRALGMDPKNLK